MSAEVYNFNGLTKMKLEKLNEVFLRLSSDFDKNVQLITAACGEALDARIALYNKIHDQKLIFYWLLEFSKIL